MLKSTNNEHSLDQDYELHQEYEPDQGPFVWVNIQVFAFGCLKSRAHAGKELHNAEVDNNTLMQFIVFITINPLSISNSLGFCEGLIPIKLGIHCEILECERTQKN